MSNPWVDLGNICGPPGATGPEGPVGPPGQGLNILGTLDDVSQLPPTGNPGDAWFVGCTLYFWPGTSSGGGGGGGGGALLSGYIPLLNQINMATRYTPYTLLTFTPPENGTYLIMGRVGSTSGQETIIDIWLGLDATNTSSLAAGGFYVGQSFGGFGSVNWCGPLTTAQTVHLNAETNLDSIFIAYQSYQENLTSVTDLTWLKVA